MIGIPPTLSEEIWSEQRAENFESWREGWKGPSKSGEKCSRRKVHMYDHCLNTV
jgi:hypothetical protein